MAMPKATLHLPAQYYKSSLLDLCKNGLYEQVFERLQTRNKIYPYKKHIRAQCLLYAAAQGNLEAVRKLVETFEFDPRYVCNGLSPLFCAIAYGYMEIVDYFVIKKGCNPKSESKAAKAVDSHGDLMYDIPSSLLFVCKLTEYAGSVSKYSLNDRPIEASHIHVEILKFLFAHGWTYDKKTYSIWEYGTNNRGSADVYCIMKFLMVSACLDDLVYLIDHNFLPVNEIEPVLASLICGGSFNIEMLRFLMHKGAFSVSVNMIERAACNDSNEVCLFLLEHCTEDTIVLLDSFCRDRLPVLSKAIAECNLNSQDSAGRTPLHIACEYDDLKLVSFLVSQQCDQSIADADGHLALHVACMHSSLEVLKLLSFSEKNKTNQVGNTAVHVACKEMREDIVKYLIKDKNCDVNVLNNRHELPLHTFIRSTGRRMFRPCNMELLALLCDYVDVNTPDSEGCTPVKLACDLKAVDIVEYLACEMQCRLDVQDSRGELPLNCFITNDPYSYSAVEFDATPTVKKILGCNDFNVDNKDKQHKTLLHCACSIRAIELVRYLVVEKKCGVSQANEEGDLPVHIACRTQSLEIVKLVTIAIDKGSLAFRNKGGYTPLHIICDDYDQGELRKAIAQHLVDIGCKPVDNPELFKDLDISLACVDENDFDSLLSKIATNDNVKREQYYQGSLLHLACEKGNMLAVRHFTQVLECGSSTPYRGKLPLHYASAHSVEMVECVFEEIYVNAADYSSNTPLHIACNNNKTSIVKFFTDMFICDQSVLNTDKENPLHLSCTGSLETVKLLTITAEHLLQISSSGLTPLHVACKYNKLDIVQYLLEVMKERGLEVSSVVDRGTVHPLRLACETGNAQLVKFLTDKGVNMFDKLRDGNTILHIACSVGSLEMVKYLIDSGHDTLVANSREEFPLHIACTKNLSLVEITSCKCGAAELEAKAVDGRTPLHLAASSGLLDVVKYLVETLHCSPFTPDSYGNNALAYACGFVTGKRTPTVSSNIRYLVGCGCSPMDKVWLRFHEEEHSKSLVQRVIDQRDFHVFEIIFCSEMFVNCQDEDANTPLILLCKEARNLRMPRHAIDFLSQGVEYLAIERNCDQLVQNSKQELALHLACESGCFEIVKRLDNHCDIKNGAGDTALHIVCRRNDLQILEKFVQQSKLAGCGPQAFNILNNESQSPLHLAVISDSEEIVKLLLSDHEVKDISFDSKGLAPVHYASSVSVLKVLTDHNIENRDLLDNCGNSPLHTFIKSKVYSLAMFLLAADAVVDVKNNDGNTPLHLICTLKLHPLHHKQKLERKRLPISMCFDLPSVIQKLLSHVSSLSVKNNDGDTPLHIACRSKDVRLVNLLLESQHEVDLTIQNNSGDTPFHIACATACFPIVDALLRLGNSVNVLAIKNSNGDIPFHVALELFQRSQRGKVKKSKDSLEFFANNCSDINIQNKNKETLLHLSCKVVNSYSTYIVEFLVKSGADLTIVDAHKQLPLHVAASKSLKMVKLCCLPNLIDQQDKAGNTALHIACIHSQLEVASFLLTEMECSPAISNGKRQTPFHCACQAVPSSNDLIVLLAKFSKASLNHQDANGDTPVHLLCKNSNQEGLAEVINQVSTMKSNFELQNNSGETPLHIVCSNPKSPLELVKCVANCDPELKLKDSPCDTALHLACRNCSSKVIQFLLENRHQHAAEVPNQDGDLPIHILCKRDSLSNIQLMYSFFKLFDHENIHGDTPLHIALKNDVSNEVIFYLIEEANCDVTIQNGEGDLPLHIACRNTTMFKGKLQKLLTYSEIVNVQNLKKNSALHEYLENCKVPDTYFYEPDALNANLKFLLQLGANPSLSNAEGRCPIHIACERTSLTAVKLLEPHGLTVVSSDGNTVLHEACANDTRHAPKIVKYLLNYQPPLNYSSTNANRDLALHIACRNPKLHHVIESIFKQLLQHCDVNLPNKDGDTVLFELLHSANSPNLALELLKDVKINLQNINGKQETVLHLACRHNFRSIVSFLLSQRLSDIKEFINHPNIDEQTPIVLTTDREIVQLLLDNGATPDTLYKMHDNFFRDYSLSSPPEMPVSILVVGDPRAGKTTLVSSLKKEKEGTKSETIHRTAGIVPNDFKSEEYGQVIMYDFAGQPEYYASHNAVIHAIIKKLPPVVLLVVDLTLPIDHTIKAVNYWSSFINNRLQSLTDRAHLYVICSHADIVVEKGEDPQKKAKALLNAVKVTLNEVKIFDFKGMLTMDCTDPQSQELGKLRSHFVTSTKQLRRKAVINFESHCLSVYVKQTFADKIVILFDKLLFEVSRAAKKSQDAPELLPKDPNQLKKICQDLNDTGVIVFLEGSHCSWLVLDKDALLQEVSGKLFAPSSFPEYVGVYGSPTGVVSFSKLREIFPHYDPNMLFGFLCQMEYCQEIIDENVKQILRMKEAKSSNKHYFFPHAVRVERPPEVWQHNKGYQFGLIMKCGTRHHFNPYFVQILLLRLIFTQTDIMKLDISRSWSIIWKSGLTWLNCKGISTLVDVIDHSKVVVLVHCKDAVKDKVNCLLHRSSLLKIIRRIKINICPAVEVEEFLMDPENLSIGSEVVVSFEDIMMRISRGDDNVLSSHGKLINLDSLLFCDPYIKLCAAMTGIIRNAECSKQQPDEEFLTALSGHLDDYFEVFIQLISPSKIHVEEISSHAKKFLKLFNLLLRRKRNPFQTLREEFDNITVFDVNSKLPGMCVK